MVPFGALPFTLAGALMTALLVAATAGALWLLDVRDWRCYGVVFLSFTTIGAIRLATLTPLLLLGLAATWRYRARTVPAGLLVAAVVLLKGFLWPVGLWLLMTRRFAAAALAAGVTAVATLIGFAVVGFDSVERYREALGRLADAVDGQGYSLVALAGAAGASESAGRYLALLVGLGLLAWAAHAAWVRADEASAFVVVAAASLALSPIVWLHYLALLFVPIAIARPRLSPLWLVPLVLWATPYQETDGDLWRIVLAWLTVGVVVGGAVARPDVRVLSRWRSRELAA
jgi:hypothetical protein